MAYRAAADYRRAAGLIVLAHEVPSDVKEGIPPVLVGRGVRDDLYPAEKLEKDLSFLRSVTKVTACVFDGGHEWTDEFRVAANEFLRALSSRA